MAQQQAAGGAVHAHAGRAQQAGRHAQRTRLPAHRRGRDAEAHEAEQQHQLQQQRRPQRRAAALRPALLLELALLLGFMGFGIAASPMGREAGALGMASGLLGAAGMGVHSATSRLLLGHLAPTSMMTGHVTQIVIDLVDAIRGADDPGLKTRCVKFIWPLVAFALGCIAAAFAFHRFGFAALVLPILILVGLLVAEAPAPAGQKQANAS